MPAPVLHGGRRRSRAAPADRDRRDPRRARSPWRRRPTCSFAGRRGPAAARRPAARGGRAAGAGRADGAARARAADRGRARAGRAARRRRRVPRAPAQAAARRARVRRATRGEVLWRARPTARAADGEPDEDHDRAARGRARAGRTTRCGSRRRRCTTRAPGSACCRAGKRVRLETLLNGLLIVSGNDAAIALAVHVAGNERRFVGADEPARARLGARAARTSPPRTASRTATARARATWRCSPGSRWPSRASAASCAAARSVFRFPIKGHSLYLYGHNPLIRLGYPGTIGLKTGYTDAAGPLLRGRGAPRRPHARRGAAELARPGEARGEAAGRGVRAALERAAQQVEERGEVALRRLLVVRGRVRHRVAVGGALVHLGAVPDARLVEGGVQSGDLLG